MHILVLHGPNLNLLGEREPLVYGTTTLDEIDAALEAAAAGRGARLTIRQTNHEGELIDLLHEHRGLVDGVLVNAGGLSHTSVALRDAVAAGPVAVEVHLSNIHARERFRRRSLLSGVCAAVITGFGPSSYRLGLEGLLDLIGSGPEAARPGTGRVAKR